MIFKSMKQRIYDTIGLLTVRVLEVRDKIESFVNMSRDRNKDQDEINLIFLATLQRILLDHGANGESGKYDGDVELVQAIVEKINKLEK